MKRALLVLAVLFMAVTAFAADAKVAIFVHAPLAQLDSATGKPYGPTIDFMNAVMKEMGVTPTYVIMPIPRILNELQAGTIDITLEIGKTPEREAFLYYPEKYAYVMKPALTFKADSPTSAIKSIADVKGMRIGYLSGAAVPKFFEGSTDVKFELVSGDAWIRQNLDKVLAGRIDAGLDQNAVSYMAEAKKAGQGALVKTIVLPGSGTEAFVVFSKKSPNGKTLLDAFNKAMATGKFDESKMIDDYLKK